MRSGSIGGRFFQAIVMMGAAAGLEACGGDTNADGGNGGAGGGGGSAAGSSGPSQPSDCDEPGHFRCNSYFPNLDCVCDPSLPTKPEDCAYSSQFVCECQCPGGEICLCPLPPGSNGVMSCKCDAARPTGPEDCPTTADFQCNQWGPPWQDCSCTEGAPMSAEECLDAKWSCQSYAPPIGCKCFSIITK